MFNPCFTRRSAQSTKEGNRFTPRLECLEDRLAPSGLNPLGANDVLPPQPSPPQRFINPLDSYDMSTGQPLSVVLNNLAVNQFFSVASMSPGQAQQTFALLYNQLLASDPQLAASANALIATEMQLAQDTVSLLPIIVTNTPVNPLLIQSIHHLQNEIQTNPVEGTAPGPMLGALAFDLSIGMALST